MTPSLLALRVWAATIFTALARGLARLGARRLSMRAQDWAQARAARHARLPVIMWEEPPQTEVVALETGADAHADQTPEEDDSEDRSSPDAPLRAAE